MKKRFHTYLPSALFAVTILVMAACEKDITVNIPQVDKKPVVEGSIFQGEFATVGITWSFPYFKPLTNIDPNDPSSLEEFLVLNADITLSDGFTSEKLSMTYDPALFPPLVYRGDSIVGTPGRTYTLNIKFPGYELGAVTSIPYPIPLDSIGFKLDQGQDSLGFAYMYFQEPNTVGNIYRLFSKRPNYALYQPTYAVGNSVLDDQAYNGKYIEFLFGRPDPQSNIFSDPDTTDTQEDEEEGYWKIGDTIMVRFCTIDRTSYDFIKTLEASAGTSGNPFSNPTTVKSNITSVVGGAALGGWIGYGVADIQAIAQ